MSTKDYRCKLCRDDDVFNRWNVHTRITDLHVVMDMIAHYGYPLDAYVDGAGWVIQVYALTETWFQVTRNDLFGEYYIHTMDVYPHRIGSFSLGCMCSYVRVMLGIS